MKWMMALVLACGVASCDAYQTSQTVVGEAAKVLKAAQSSATNAGSRPTGSPGAIAVVTTKTVPDYYKDLEHCRSVVAASMGPAGPDDDLEALKRALKEHPHASTLSLTYVNDDLAIKRREAIKHCLSNLGYLVK